LAVAVAALIARYLPGRFRAIVATAALAPYLMLGAPVAMVVFTVRGHWLLAGGAAVIAVAVVAVQLPRFLPGRRASSTGIRAMSANLRYGRADPGALVLAATEHADILAVQELTPDKASLLVANGIAKTFPYCALRAREGPAGVGIWSRYPIDSSTVDERFWLGFVMARVRWPGARTSATVAVTHMSAPWPDPIRGWREDLAMLRETLTDIGRSEQGPVVVAGDFNATPDVREFRRLLRGGYRDAAEQAGAGLTRTHPADVPLVPPVFAVDHILVLRCDASAVRTLPIKDSDHRALLATIHLSH
jgi:endonuclease/exonuclease/phosphatase family metal-dependent hydrolase